MFPGPFAKFLKGLLDPVRRRSLAYLLWCTGLTILFAPAVSGLLLALGYVRHVFELMLPKLVFELTLSDVPEAWVTAAFVLPLRFTARKILTFRRPTVHPWLLPYLLTLGLVLSAEIVLGRDFLIALTSASAFEFRHSLASVVTNIQSCWLGGLALASIWVTILTWSGFLPSLQGVISDREGRVAIYFLLAFVISICLHVVSILVRLI